MVLATHVAFQTGEVSHGQLGRGLARLDIGVALFFVLSGFLLGRPWFTSAMAGRPQVGTRRYLVRRAARILPAYWAVLAVVLLTTGKGSDLRTSLSNALLTQDFTGSLIPGFTQTWSLCTEVSFYLVLPLAAPFLGRLAARSTLAAWGVLSSSVALSLAWIALAVGGHLPPRAAGWLPGHLSWFAAGLALALLDQVRRTDPDSAVAVLAAALARKPGALVALAVSTFWLATTPLGGPLTLTSPTLFTAMAKEVLYCIIATALVGAVAFADQQHGPLASGLASWPAQFLGRVSYGVFLWHVVVLAGVMAVLNVEIFTGRFWMVLMFTALGATTVAWLSWHLLEAPILRRAHRVGAASRSVPALTGSS